MVTYVFGDLTTKLFQLDAVVREPVLFIQYRRRIADLAKFHQALQNRKLRPVNTLAFYRTKYFITEVVPVRLINVTLFVFHFTVKDRLYFFRKVFCYLFLCSSE